MNMWITIISWIVQIIFEVMLGTDSYHIFICTGSPPSNLYPGQKLVGSSRVNIFIQLLTAFVHLVVFLKIKVYKWKRPASGNSVHPRSKIFWLTGLEKQSLSDMTTNCITVVFFAVTQIQISFVNLEDLNHFPQYLSEYFYRLIRVPLMVTLLVIVFYIRHRELRQTVKRELQNIFGFED